MDAENMKILNGDGTAPKAVPEDTSGIGEDGVPLSARDQPGVQFISPSRDNDAKVELGGSPGNAPQFVGLGKEELMRYANDPFWVRLRWFLFILFWLIWGAMLAVAIAIIVLAPKCASTTKVATHVANSGPYYQIAMRSIPDADKFAGLKPHLEHISTLGVRTVIISQFQNPQDLKGVDPNIGTIENFKELINAFKAKGIKVLLQLSPNHSKKDHPWFTEHPEYYVLEESSKVGDSVWRTVDGQQKAWTPTSEGDKSYLHQFHETEPDFNYAEDTLVDEMNGVLKHWYSLSDGIFGFLLSDVSYLVEDLQKLDDQNATINQPENKAVLEKILDSTNWEVGSRPGPYALLDVDKLDAKATMTQYTGDSLLPILTDIMTLPSNFTSDELRSRVESDATKTHFVLRRLSNSDERVTSRFTVERANILTMITYILRGEVIVYYGDEIGLPDSESSMDGTDSGDDTVEKMKWNLDSSENKIYNFYKCLGEVHNLINQTESKNDADTIYYVENGAFGFKRMNYVVITSLDVEDVELNLSEKFSLSENIMNGTIRCATPNVAIPADHTIHGEAFVAAPFSGYVLEFGAPIKE